MAAYRMCDYPVHNRHEFCNILYPAIPLRYERRNEYTKRQGRYCAKAYRHLFAKTIRNDESRTDNLTRVFTRRSATLKGAPKRKTAVFHQKLPSLEESLLHRIFV